MTKYKNGNFIEFHGLDVQLNGAGTGHVEGSFQLHSDGVKEWTGSPVLGKLSKAINKTMVMRVPINGYTVQLNGINLGMPAWVAKKILGFATSKIRVSNKSGETLLKIPAISGYSGSALGQLDPSEGTQRILTAKQEFAARDSQGAISIEALLQNNIQRQLNAVRSTLENV
jgi:hypothetical protein